MPSQLSQFCRHFDATVRGILDPLDAALAGLRAAPAGTSGQELVAELADLRRQIAALVDKVAGQQAYVLIFGPLKSGKSTLMNAIAGAYVSEVSSLPAYPCLVFVRHGEQREFTVRSYDGASESFTDAAGLRQRIDAAHADLAEHIRACENAGEAFDPAHHFPAAIQRVDARLPAPNLRQTGAVLVDTPGLYTRMRFGYDRMTRDFRHAAACAVFVVKTDNLFLEQVFTEFHQLLELFSRIFLVVNVDATKRDVGPDGALVPSVEQREPERILAAFESFAMSGPLKQAADEGRLRLYPVDLMHAASAVLGRQAGKKTSPPASFNRFRSELEEYLASSDYLVAFLRDSLQRAARLLGEVAQLADGDVVQALLGELRDAQQQRSACQSDLEGITACLARDWTAAFAAAGQELTEAVQRRARDEGGRTARAMGAAIDTWSLSSHSLHDLLAGEWAPMLRDFHSAVAHEARRVVEQTCAGADGCMQLEHQVAHFLRFQGIEPRALCQRALAALPPPAAPPETVVPVDADEIPIRRGVLDVVALRSEASVRRKLLGSRERPDRKIPARVKKARLGEPAKNYLRETLMRFRKEVLPRFTDELLRHYRDDLRTAFVESLRAALREREPALRQQEAALAAEQERLQAVLGPLAALRDATAELQAKVHALSVQHAKVDPEELAERAAGGGRTAILDPHPRR